MKRIGCALFLLLTVIFVGSQCQYAEASDYYLGVYDNGQQAYLVTETIQFAPYRYKEDGPGYYTCTVKSVDLGARSFSNVSYRIDLGQMGAIFTKNGRTFNRQEMTNILKQPNSVEMRLLAYIKSYHKQTGKGSIDGY